MREVSILLLFFDSTHNSMEVPMASVKNRPTRAQMLLDHVLGKKYVSFGQLSVSESNELLRTTLRDVDLRELRGFKPLKDLLVFQPGSTITGGTELHTLDLETLKLSDHVSFSALGFEETPPVDLDTQVMSLCRGFLNWKIIFKRNESGEETNDRETAYSWGRSAYHCKGSGEVLVLRRPRNHSRADENLLIVSFSYEKVPLERKHIVTKIEVTFLPLNNFRKYFSPLYAKVAVGLIEELKSAYSSTESELRSQLDYIERKTVELEKLSKAITYR